MAIEFDGLEVSYLRTLKSRYDNGCIEVYTEDKTHLRIHVDELVKMMWDYNFEVERKRVHAYLKNPKKK